MQLRRRWRVEAVSVAVGVAVSVTVGGEAVSVAVGVAVSVTVGGASCKVVVFQNAGELSTRTLAMASQIEFSRSA